MSVKKYTCPAGFDCIYRNSCPAAVIPCPKGFFCSTYGESEYVDEIDIGYTTYKEFFGQVDVTKETYLQYVELSRQIQSLCVRGFYCPNSTTILPCSEGHWCAEGSIGPNKCEPLSIAVPSEFSYFQINFVNLLIMLIISIVVITISSYLIQSNKINEKKCKEIHNRRFNERTEKSEEVLSSDADIENIAKDDYQGQIGKSGGEGVELFLSHCSYSYKKPIYDVETDADSSKVLRDVCAYFPAGSISAIMGPSCCGKTTLLNLIRTRYVKRLSSRSAVNPDPGELHMNILRNSDSNSDSCGNSKSESNGLHRERVTDQNDGSFIGFVPQEDIVDRTLTVRELLMFNIRVRRNLSLVDCEKKVNEVLNLLHLNTVADTIIGGGGNASASISGGQLKRVNIAVELVSLSEPSLLLLDEPTGGLDASVALQLFDNLRSLSRRGTTVIMSLQQPRPEIFSSVDLAMLLSMNGHMVYFGKPREASSFISECGFDQPDNCSDADFCIDVLNSIIGQNDNSNSNSNSNNNSNNNCNSGSNVDDQNRAVADVNCNSNSSASSVDKEIELSNTIPSSSNKDISNHYSNEAKLAMVAGIDRLKLLGTQRALQDKEWIEASKSFKSNQNVTASSTSDRSNDEVEGFRKNFRRFFVTVQLSIWRSFITRLRAHKTLIVYAAIHVIMAGALSSGFSILIMGTTLKTVFPPVRDSLKGYYPSVLKHMENRNPFELGFQQLLFFMSSAVGSAAGLCAIQLFSGRHDVMRRETKAGINVFASAIGHYVTDLLIISWNASLFVGTWKLFGHPGLWSNWLVSIAATSFASSGLGYICGVTVSSGQASFTALIANMICCVFSGIEPKLAQVSDLPVLNLLWYFSFATWTAQSIYFTFSQYLTNEGRVPARLEEGAAVYGYNISSLSQPILYLFLFGIATRVIAATIIHYKTK